MVKWLGTCRIEEIPVTGEAVNDERFPYDSFEGMEAIKVAV